MTGRHIIGQQIFEVHTHSRLQSERVSDELSQIAKHKLNERIEKIFNKHCRNGTVYKFDKITLDIGSIQQKNIRYDLPEVICTQIDIALGKLINGQDLPVLSETDQQIEALRHFLIHGKTSWNNSDFEVSGLEAVWSKLVKQSPHRFIDVISSLSNEPKIWDRIYFQFSPRLLNIINKSLWNKKWKIIESLLSELEWLIGKLHLSQSKYSKKYWLVESLKLGISHSEIVSPEEYFTVELLKIYNRPVQELMIPLDKLNRQNGNSINNNGIISELQKRFTDYDISYFSNETGIDEFNKWINAFDYFLKNGKIDTTKFEISFNEMTKSLRELSQTGNILLKTFLLDYHWSVSAVRYISKHFEAALIGSLNKLIVGEQIHLLNAICKEVVIIGNLQSSISQNGKKELEGIIFGAIVKCQKHASITEITGSIVGDFTAKISRDRQIWLTELMEQCKPDVEEQRILRDSISLLLSKSTSSDRPDIIDIASQSKELRIDNSIRTKVQLATTFKKFLLYGITPNKYDLTNIHKKWQELLNANPSFLLDVIRELSEIEGVWDRLYHQFHFDFIEKLVRAYWDTQWEIVSRLTSEFSDYVVNFHTDSTKFNIKYWLLLSLRYSQLDKPNDNFQGVINYFLSDLEFRKGDTSENLKYHLLKNIDRPSLKKEYPVMTETLRNHDEFKLIKKEIFSTYSLDELIRCIEHMIRHGEYKYGAVRLSLRELDRGIQNFKINQYADLRQAVIKMNVPNENWLPVLSTLSIKSVHILKDALLQEYSHQFQSLLDFIKPESLWAHKLSGAAWYRWSVQQMMLYAVEYKNEFSPKSFVLFIIGKLSILEGVEAHKIVSHLQRLRQGKNSYSKILSEVLDDLSAFSAQDNNDSNISQKYIFSGNSNNLLTNAKYDSTEILSYLFDGQVIINGNKLGDKIIVEWLKHIVNLRTDLFLQLIGKHQNDTSLWNSVAKLDLSIIKKINHYLWKQRWRDVDKLILELKDLSIAIVRPAKRISYDQWLIQSIRIGVRRDSKYLDHNTLFGFIEFLSETGGVPAYEVISYISHLRRTSPQKVKSEILHSSMLQKLPKTGRKLTSNDKKSSEQIIIEALSYYLKNGTFNLKFPFNSIAQLEEELLILKRKKVKLLKELITKNVTSKFEIDILTKDFSISTLDVVNRLMCGRNYKLITTCIGDVAHFLKQSSIDYVDWNEWEVKTLVKALFFNKFQNRIKKNLWQIIVETREFYHSTDIWITQLDQMYEVIPGKHHQLRGVIKDIQESHTVQSHDNSQDDLSILKTSEFDFPFDETINIDELRQFLLIGILPAEKGKGVTDDWLSALVFTKPYFILNIIKEFIENKAAWNRIYLQFGVNELEKLNLVAWGNRWEERKKELNQLGAFLGRIPLAILSDMTSYLLSISLRMAMSSAQSSESSTLFWNFMDALSELKPAIQPRVLSHLKNAALYLRSIDSSISEFLFVPKALDLATDVPVDYHMDPLDVIHSLEHFLNTGTLLMDQPPYSLDELENEIVKLIISKDPILGVLRTLIMNSDAYRSRLYDAFSIESVQRLFQDVNLELPKSLAGASISHDVDEGTSLEKEAVVKLEQLKIFFDHGIIPWNGVEHGQQIEWFEPLLKYESKELYGALGKCADNERAWSRIDRHFEVALLVRLNLGLWKDRWSGIEVKLNELIKVFHQIPVGFISDIRILLHSESMRCGFKSEIGKEDISVLEILNSMLNRVNPSAQKDIIEHTKHAILQHKFDNSEFKKEIDNHQFELAKLKLPKKSTKDDVALVSSFKFFLMKGQLRMGQFPFTIAQLEMGVIKLLEKEQVDLTKISEILVRSSYSRKYIIDHFSIETIDLINQWILGEVYDKLVEVIRELAVLINVSSGNFDKFWTDSVVIRLFKSLSYAVNNDWVNLLLVQLIYQLSFEKGKERKIWLLEIRDKCLSLDHRHRLILNCIDQIEPRIQEDNLVEGDKNSYGAISDDLDQTGNALEHGEGMFQLQVFLASGDVRELENEGYTIEKLEKTILEKCSKGDDEFSGVLMDLLNSKEIQFRFSENFSRATKLKVFKHLFSPEWSGFKSFYNLMQDFFNIKPLIGRSVKANQSAVDAAAISLGIDHLFSLPHDALIIAWFQLFSRHVNHIPRELIRVLMESLNSENIDHGKDFLGYLGMLATHYEIDVDILRPGGVDAQSHESELLVKKSGVSDTGVPGEAGKEFGKYKTDMQELFYDFLNRGTIQSHNSIHSIRDLEVEVVDILRRYPNEFKGKLLSLNLPSVISSRLTENFTFVTNVKILRAIYNQNVQWQVEEVLNSFEKILQLESKSSDNISVTELCHFLIEAFLLRKPRILNYLELTEYLISRIAREIGIDKRLYLAKTFRDITKVQVNKQIVQSIQHLNGALSCNEKDRLVLDLKENWKSYSTKSADQIRIDTFRNLIESKISYGHFPWWSRDEQSFNILFKELIEKGNSLLIPYMSSEWSDEAFVQIILKDLPDAQFKQLLRLSIGHYVDLVVMSRIELMRLSVLVNKNNDDIARRIDSIILDYVFRHKSFDSFVFVKYIIYSFCKLYKLELRDVLSIWESDIQSRSKSSDVRFRKFLKIIRGIARTEQPDSWQADGSIILQSPGKLSSTDELRKKSVDIDYTSRTIIEMNAIQCYWSHKSLPVEWDIFSSYEEMERTQLNLIRRESAICRHMYKQLLSEETVAENLLSKSTEQLMIELTGILFPHKASDLHELWFEIEGILGHLYPDFIPAVARKGYYVQLLQNLDKFTKEGSHLRDVFRSYLASFHTVSIDKLESHIKRIVESIAVRKTEDYPIINECVTKMGKVRKKDNIEPVAIKKESTELEDKVFVTNAGMVLLHPYLSRYFGELNMLENGLFRSDDDIRRAIHLLQYLASGQTRTSEHLLFLNKILCGLPLQDSLPIEISLSEQEISLSSFLLNSVLQNWPQMSQSTVQNLQGAYLLRSGMMEEKSDAWVLTVETKPYDVLLDFLPWSVSMVMLPWMTKRIEIIWKTKS